MTDVTSSIARTHCAVLRLRSRFPAGELGSDWTLLLSLPSSPSHMALRQNYAEAVLAGG